MFVLPHVTASLPNSDTSTAELILGYAKYHGHCYRLQLEPSGPDSAKIAIVLEQALRQEAHPKSLEQACGLSLVSTIVQSCCEKLLSQGHAISKAALSKGLRAIRNEAAEQRVYWMQGPDSSRLWQQLPDAALNKIVSHLSKHDMLQLRAVSYGWKAAEERLWKVWSALQPALFPQSVVPTCRGFKDHRLLQESYLHGAVFYDNADLRLSCLDKMGRQFWVQDGLIFHRSWKSSSYGGDLGQTELVVVSAHSGRTLFKESCTSEVRTPTGPNGYVSRSYDGWLQRDGLLLACDVATGELKAYDAGSGQLLNKLELPGKILLDADRKGGPVLELLSIDKKLLRYDLTSGRVESLVDYSQVDDADYAAAERGQLCDSLVIIHGNKASWVFDKRNPVLGPQKFDHLGQLYSFRDCYLSLHCGQLRCLERDKQGQLQLRWEHKGVNSLHLQAGRILANCSPYNGVHLLNQATGESERELCTSSWSSVDTFVDGQRLYVCQEPYQQKTKLRVIDIPSGHELFHCTWPGNTHFLGASGDTLYRCDRNGGALEELGPSNG